MIRAVHKLDSRLLISKTPVERPCNDRDSRFFDSICIFCPHRPCDGEETTHAVKVNCILFSKGQLGKGKVHPCTGTEALYRPYGP